jgi:hypothetical protein
MGLNTIFTKLIFGLENLDVFEQVMSNNTAVIHNLIIDE